MLCSSAFNFRMAFNTSTRASSRMLSLRRLVSLGHSSCGICIAWFICASNCAASSLLRRVLLSERRRVIFSTLSGLMRAMSISASSEITRRRGRLRCCATCSRQSASACSIASCTPLSRWLPLTFFQMLRLSTVKCVGLHRLAKSSSSQLSRSSWSSWACIF